MTKSEEFSYEIWSGDKMLVRITGIGRKNTRSYAINHYNRFVARGWKSLELRGPPRKKKSNAEEVKR
jgi:hypothetical protein